ncbi:MAG: type II toxin-antitoxin system ParD family antitoxin [Chitinophagales bacterium]|nr:type II toxin-antitoxin system ParD family antitoxin [Chitinophagales bacterium]
MSKHTSILLSEHFEQVIQNGIESGRYDSASDVIMAGLRLFEQEETKIKLLRKAIEAGENSGYVANFDPIEHLEKLNLQYKK